MQLIYIIQIEIFKFLKLFEYFFCYEMYSTERNMVEYNTEFFKHSYQSQYTSV